MREHRSREPGTAPGSGGRGSEGASVVCREDELAVDAETREVGSVRVRKSVERDEVNEMIPRSVEAFDEVERTPPNEQDSGDVEECSRMALFRSRCSRRNSSLRSGQSSANGWS